MWRNDREIDRIDVMPNIICNPIWAEIPVSIRMSSRTSNAIIIMFCLIYSISIYYVVGNCRAVVGCGYFKIFLAVI